MANYIRTHEINVWYACHQKVVIHLPTALSDEIYVANHIIKPGSFPQVFYYSLLQRFYVWKVRSGHLWPTYSQHHVLTRKFKLSACCHAVPLVSLDHLLRSLLLGID